MDSGANSSQLHDTSSAVEKADVLSAFETFGTNNKITRHIEMIIRQEKSIFVGFQKITGWHIQE